jgi:hypothetical protein
VEKNRKDPHYFIQSGKMHWKGLIFSLSTQATNSLAGLKQMILMVSQHIE